MYPLKSNTFPFLSSLIPLLSRLPHPNRLSVSLSGTLTIFNSFTRTNRKRKDFYANDVDNRHSPAITSVFHQQNVGKSKEKDRNLNFNTPRRRKCPFLSRCFCRKNGIVSFFAEMEYSFFAENGFNVLLIK